MGTVLVTSASDYHFSSSLAGIVFALPWLIEVQVRYLRLPLASYAEQTLLLRQMTQVLSFTIVANIFTERRSFLEIAKKN